MPQRRRSSLLTESKESGENRLPSHCWPKLNRMKPVRNPTKAFTELLRKSNAFGTITSLRGETGQLGNGPAMLLFSYMKSCTACGRNYNSNLTLTTFTSATEYWCGSAMVKRSVIQYFFKGLR